MPRLMFLYNRHALSEYFTHEQIRSSALINNAVQSIPLFQASRQSDSSGYLPDLCTAPKGNKGEFYYLDGNWLILNG
jgi:hypothetical protein